MSDPMAIEVRRHLPAAVDEVFAWWTEAVRLRQWMTPFGTVEAEVDLRIGGALRIVMTEGETRIEHTGEYLEIVRPSRLVFTWRSPYTGPDPSLVTVELDPDGEGGTLLRLVHSRLRGEVGASHRDGWGKMLDRLASTINRRQQLAVDMGGH